LAEKLIAKRQFMRLFTRDAILRRLPDTPRTRADLQAAGERLDRDTGGQWVADELQDLIARAQASPGVVVDAVLIPEQVKSIRATTMQPVIHVHLTAPTKVLEARYAYKQGGIKESERYSELLRSATEANVDQLRNLADLVFDSSVTTIEYEVDSVIARLGRTPS
jgi:adenylosuccinate synthase